MKYKNYCVSNDAIYQYEKRCDKFKISLGSGFFLHNGVLQKVNGNLEVKGYSDDIYNVYAETLGSIPVDETSSGVPENIQDLIDTGSLPIFPSGGSGGGGMVELGNGLYVQLGVGSNPTVIQQEQSRTNDFGNIQIDGSVGGGRTGEGIYLRPLDINVRPSGSNVGNSLADTLDDLSVDSSSSVPDFIESLPKGTDIFQDTPSSEIFIKFDTDMVEEHYVLSKHPFKVVLEISPYLITDLDFSIYRCRVYIPELSVLLHSNSIKLENAIKSGNLTLPANMLNYISYFKILYKYLTEYQKTKERFWYYNFKYNSAISTNGERDYCIFELSSCYNYYKFDFEEYASSHRENEIISYYDIYSQKTFDTRGGELKSLQGTEKNVAFILDGQEECELANYYFSLRKNVPYGVSFAFPSYYSDRNKILSDNELLSLYSLTVFRDFVKRDYDYSRNDYACVSLHNGIARLLETRKTFLTSWLRAMRFGVLPEYDTKSFDVTVYDFGFHGDIYDNRILSDLSLFEKKVFASSAIDRLTSSLTRGVEYIFNDKEQNSDVFGYTVEKINFGGAVVHRIFSVVNNSAFNNISFFDTQLKFNEKYTYRISTCNLFEESEYFYGRPINVEEFDENLKAINFSLVVRKGISSMFLPQWEEVISVLDAPPVPPEVSVEQFRDDKRRVRFVLNSGYGSCSEKFVVIDNRDKAFYDMLTEIGKVDQDGKIQFRSDDFARYFEVYVSKKSRPTSYKDFEKIVILDNQKSEEGYSIATSSNCFETTIPVGESWFFFFRQVDVHGNRSNPTDVFHVSFSDFGTRSILNCQVIDAETLFSGKKYNIYSVGMRKYLFVRINREKIKNKEYFSKKYKIFLVSKKTKRVCEIGCKFSFNNN